MAEHGFELAQARPVLREANGDWGMRPSEFGGERGEPRVNVAARRRVGVEDRSPFGKRFDGPIIQPRLRRRAQEGVEQRRAAAFGEPTLVEAREVGVRERAGGGFRLARADVRGEA